MEFTLLGSVAIAVVAIYAVLWLEGGRTNAADCTRDVWDALIGAAVVGILVGRLFAMVEAGSSPFAHPGDILIVRGGVDTISASLAAVVTYAVLTRRDRWVLLDAAAPAALAGLAGWHAGCLVRDACLGTVSDLPWAIAQSPGGATRHPVEIYTAVALGIAVVAFVWWKYHRPRSGTIGLAAIGVAAAVRLATEPMRLGLGSGLEWWYAAAAASAGAAVLWRSRWSPSSDYGA